MNKTVMDTIYKYPLIEQTTHLDIPLPAKFLSLGKDAEGNTCVWFIVNPDSSETESYWFYKYGTGWPIDRELYTQYCQFIGTVIEEPYVWHVFMEGAKEKEKEKENYIYKTIDTENCECRWERYNDNDLKQFKEDLDATIKFFEV